MELLEARRFQLFLKISKWLCPSYRHLWPQMEWLKDVAFNGYLQEFGELDGLNSFRRWNLYQLVRLVADVPGDTAECGVYQGAGSYLICASNRDNKRHKKIHHVFDSFEGLSDPSKEDGSHWTSGDLSSSEEVLRTHFTGLDNYEVHKGWIPGRFAVVQDRRFSLVHIDVDLYRPTKDSVDFFYPRLNEGGILICDDYGFTTCPGATKAVDDYFGDKNEKMISMADGGGFVIKGVTTAATSV